MLTVAVIANLYFTFRLATTPQIPQETFISGSTIPAGIKHNGLALGEDNAPVTVEMFSDFQCPYCKQADTTVIPQLISTYVTTGKVKFVYRPFNFLGQESYDAAQAAYCANEQGKFWEYKEALFSNQEGENQGGFKHSRLLAMGQFVELDTPQFTACIQSNKYASQVQKDTQAGAARGVQGTPTFFVNGKVLKDNSQASLFQAIDTAVQ